MRTYLVELDDKAQDDTDKAAFQISARYGPEQAARWYAGLLAAVATLSEMPTRWSTSEMDAAAYPFTEVRRLLYGKGGSVYRVLFHIVEPVETDTEKTDGVVRVLRIRHAAMRPLGQPEDEPA